MSKTAPEDGTLSGNGEDLALIERAKGGDYAAFERLMSKYEAKVYAIALNITKNEADALEVCQEAFLNVFRKLDSFAGTAQFSSWLYRVAYNQALMHIRKEAKHPKVSVDELQPGFRDDGEHAQPAVDWNQWSDQLTLNKELGAHIQAAVDALPDIYREVFLMRDVDGLSNQEIAEALDLPVATVRSRLHRARLALRGRIEDYLLAGPGTAA